MSWYDAIFFGLGFVIFWLVCIWLARTPTEDEIRQEEEVWAERMRAHDKEFEELWKRIKAMNRDG